MVTHNGYALVLLFATLVSLCGACVPGCQCTMVRSSKQQKGRKVDCAQHVAPFKSLTNLNFPPDTVHLDLARNALSVIKKGSFIQLSSLQKLNLSSNQIAFIEPGAFDGLQSLKKLDLSNNMIGAINSNMFTGLPNLEKLVLSTNRISVIPDGTFNDLRSMKRIEFNSEYLRCDCHLKWILKWTKQQHVRIPGTTVCGLPTKMKGLPLTKLKHKDLHCDHNLQLPIFEIRPSESQLVFQGDKLPFECHASALSNNMDIAWFRGGQRVTSNKTMGVFVHTSQNLDRTIFNHRLIVESLDSSHAGEWSCVVTTDSGNLTKTVHVEVRTPEVMLECPSVTNRTSKGIYSWAVSMAGLVVSQPCHKGEKGSMVTYKCDVDGRWRNLNVSACNFFKNITRKLARFAKTDLDSGNVPTLTYGVTKALVVAEENKEILDSTDVNYLAKIMSLLLPFATTDGMVSSLLVNMVSNISVLSSDVLTTAQEETRARSRMVKMLEQMSEQVDSQLLSLEWSRFSENVVIVVLSKKQVLQTGVHCSFRGSKESLNHGFTSTSFHCSSHASEINTPIYVNIPALMATKSPKPVDPAQTTEWPKENSTYSSNDISNETFVSNDTTYHLSSLDTSSLPSLSMPQELPVFPYSPNSYPQEAQANRPWEDDDSATSTSVFPTFSSSTSPWDALNISSKYFSKLSKPLNLSSHLNISAKHLFPYANISPINTIHSQHKTNVFVILHRTSKLFPVIQSDLDDPAFRKGNWAVVTPVLAVSIGGPAKNLSEPVVITFEVVDTRKPLKAAYFDFDLNEGNGGWKTDRCEIIKRNGTSIVVHVYHLSNFALLQDRSFQYRLAAFAMEPVLYVGSGVCMFCMLLVMITLMACFGSIGIPKKIKHAVVNLCLSTFLMMAAFIFGINRTDFELPCQMAGISIHYLTLCAVFWITIMSNIIYKKFIKANRPPEPPPELGPMPLPPKPILQFYFVGYGVPVIICGITAAVNINFYSGLKYCFLEWEPSLGAFYAPVALLVAWNLVLFMRISCVVRSVPETDSEAANESDNEIHTNEIELVPSQPDTTTNTTHNINLHHSNNNNNISSSNGGGYRRRYSRASNDEDEEDVVSVASIPDQERRPITQLRSLVAFLFLFIVMWMCGALAIAKPFRLIIPHQEIIFSYAYGLMSSFFGIFMVIYFICTRRDAQLSWKRVSGCAPKETYTAPMEITELQPEPTPVSQPQANGSAVKSNSNTNLSLYSQKSSNITKAYNMKNNSKQSNINLIIPNSSEISFNSAQEGFPNFYNPRQNGAAKKFWQKNRHHSKVMNKDVNRDLNSSLTDNNSAGELNHHRHSHGTSSDANTHLSIEIQIQSKEKPSVKAGSFSSSREIPVHINNQITPQNMLGSSCGAISLEHNSQVSGIRSTTPDRDKNFVSAYQQANPNQNLPQHQRSPSAGSLGTGVHPSAFTPVQPRNNNTLPRHGKNLDEGDEKLRQADKDGSVPRNQLSGTNSQTERSLQGEAPLRPVNPGVAWNPYCNLPPLTSHTATYSFTPPPPAHSQQQHYPFDYGVFPQPVSLNPQIFNLNQSHPPGPNGLSPTPLNQQVLPSFNIPPSPYLIQSQGRQVKSMSPGSSSSHSQSQTNRKNRCSGNSWRPLSGGDSSDSSRPRPKRTQAGGSPRRTVTYAPCSPVMSDSQAYEPHYQGPNQNTQQNMKKARSIDSDHHSDPTHRKKHHRSERHSRNKLTNKQRSLGWDEQFKGRPSKVNYVYVNHMYRDKVMHKLIKQASESDDLATKAFWLPRSASEYERLTQKGFCNMADDSSTSSDDGDSLDDNVWIRQSSGSDFQKKETSV